MSKLVAVLTLSEEMLMGCGKFMLAALNLSLICFLKLNCYGTFTYSMQYVHSNSSLNLQKGPFRDKPLLIAEISNFQFAEILNSKEKFRRKVLNFSHVRIKDKKIGQS